MTRGGAGSHLDWRDPPSFFSSFLHPLRSPFTDDANEDADDADADRPARRRRIERAQGGGGGDGGAPNPAPTAGTDGLETEDLPDLGVDLDNARGPPREYLAQEPVRRAVASQFRAFLRDFVDANGDRVYRGRLRDMCASNGQSLEVSYTHLCTMMPTVAVWVADAPSALLDVLHGAAFEAALSEFPEYGAIHRQVFVRIADLPIHDAIRDLRQYHLGKLVRIAGVATRRTCVYPMLQLVKYDCLKCRYLLGPFVQTDDGGEIKLGSCPQCQSKGPFAVNSAETVYQNFQKITVQEAPGSVPAGRLPRQKDVVLRHDLIDAARPGELIDVTGVYAHAYDVSLNARHGFPVFTTLLEANHVVRREDEAGAGGVRLTDDDRAECERLARDPRIGARVAAAIAPSIYGHSDIKQGLALALFGGQEKTRGTAHRLRGDINVLLLGDPGTAKSQFLKYVEAVAPRAVFATGKGASAVGLTAAVQKDPITREWTLEGGALVLADRGVCLIDEFDKMNEQVRKTERMRVGGWGEKRAHTRARARVRDHTSSLSSLSTGPRLYPRGYGAAVHLHLQGRHRHPAAGPVRRDRGGQPSGWALQFHPHLCGERGADRTHPVPV